MAHGANEAMCGEELSVIGRRILRTAIRVVNAALRRIAIVDRRLKRRDRQTRINRAADRIAHHAAVHKNPLIPTALGFDLCPISGSN